MFNNQFAFRSLIAYNQAMQREMQLITYETNNSYETISGSVQKYSSYYGPLENWWINIDKLSIRK